MKVLYHWQFEWTVPDLHKTFDANHSDILFPISEKSKYHRWRGERHISSCSILLFSEVVDYFHVCFLELLQDKTKRGQKWKKKISLTTTGLQHMLTKTPLDLENMVCPRDPEWPNDWLFPDGKLFLLFSMQDETRRLRSVSPREASETRKAQMVLALMYQLASFQDWRKREATVASCSPRRRTRTRKGRNERGRCSGRSFAGAGVDVHVQVG